MPATVKLQVVQAFDRAPIAEIADRRRRRARSEAREPRRRPSAIATAGRKPHERIAVLRRLAALMETRRDHFSRLIAREGGKPLADAIVEATRAIDGVRNAADELRNFAGREIPMGLTPASTGRWAFTTTEPIGVVAAISAFNHPLNLIVHQVAPAIAVGCPVIVKPAMRDAALLPRVRRAGARGRPRRAVVPDVHHRGQRAGRAARDGSARRVPELHRLGAGRLVTCTASSRPEPARRWSMAAPRPPSSTAAPTSMR